MSTLQHLLLGCLLLASLCLPAQNPQPTDWTKIYGDAEDQRPHRVKQYADGVYVCGSTTVLGDTYGFISKFDPVTGAVIWQKRMDVQSALSDFVYNPRKDELIVVGATLPASSSINNTSFAARIDDNTGVIQNIRVFDFVGREGFTTIIRHPNPRDPAYPYYVLGGKNPDNNAPSSFDEAVLINLADNLTEKWEHEFKGPGGIEIEMVRGLVPLSNGNLLVLGNGSVANEGVVVEVDGFLGNPLNSLYYPDFIDFYDGVELPNGDIALAGQRFQSREAIVMIVNPTTFQAQSGLIFSDLKSFREISLGNAAANGGVDPLYVTGQKKTGNIDQPVVLQIDYVPGVSTSVAYSRYLNDGANSHSVPHLWVTPQVNRLFYADSRQYATPVHGGRDLVVGNYPLDLAAFCVDDQATPHLGYVVQPTTFNLNFRTKVNGPDFYVLNAAENIPFLCEQTCAPPPVCSADFSWEANCCEASFTSNVTGVAPFTYAWDIGCDGVPDGIGNVPNFQRTFPGSGIYDVCLTVTDAAGCQRSVRKQVTITDDPPTIICQSVILPTDPGECYARYTPVIDVSDDCAEALFPFCTFSGAISGNAPIDSFPKGVTTVNCMVEDNKGQLATCQYTITVEDREPPKIVCPRPPAVVSVPGCEGGARVSWPLPTFSDNCPMAGITSSHKPEDFFPCGRTMVTYTVTDMAGLTSTCSFPVVVDCQCARIDTSFMTCTETDNRYQFVIEVTDLNAARNCTLTATSSQGGIVISGVQVSGSAPRYRIKGFVDIPSAPVPLSVNIQVGISCTCPDGSTRQCTLPVTVAVPCCKAISIDNQAQCRSDDIVSINLLGCNTLFDVQQVRYYVSDAPCAPGSPMQLIQVSQSCQPLRLSPRYHSQDICVYAEVTMGPGAGPCRLLTTDTALVKLCAPVTCALNDQTFCYAGSPITPAPLSLTINDPDTCNYTIQWFDANGAIAGATGLTYQPPALSLPAGSTSCGETFSYRAEITSVCGVSSCTAAIRLDNNDAPTGVIKLLPPDTQPLCRGEDATLEYFTNCAEGVNKQWTWEESLDGITYTDITTNGNRNPIYLTNRLYRDHWYRITEQNGSCPVDTVDFFLDVVDELRITSFTAVHAPPCDPNFVEMKVDWTPTLSGSCNYKVIWYHDGNAVHTEFANGGPLRFRYQPPSGAPLAGNFYVEISSSCCPVTVKSPVVTLDPPCELLIASPCFRCKEEKVTLRGILLNLPSGVSCTYQWYDNGAAIPGETNIDLVVDPRRYGPFVLEVTCSNGCVKKEEVDLRQCGPGATPVSVQQIPLVRAEAYPNPTEGRIRLELEEGTRLRELSVFSLEGRLLKQINGDKTEVDLSELPSGTYVLRGVTTSGRPLVLRVIRR